MKGQATMVAIPVEILVPTLHGGNPWGNLGSISHRCYREAAFEWVSTKETSWVASRAVTAIKGQATMVAKIAADTEPAFFRF